MKIKSLLVSALLLMPILCYPQVDVNLGTPYVVIDAPQKHYFHSGDEILTVKINAKFVTLQKLNSKSASFNSVKVYQDMPKDYVLEKITEYNNKYFLFYSLWDKPNQKEQLFVREIDFAKGEFTGPGKLLVKVDGKVTGTSLMSGFYSIGTVDKFMLNFSKNDSRMLVQYRKKPETRNDDKSYDVIGLVVFDQDMKQQSWQEVTMPYTEKKMNNLDYAVDSEGSTYMLTTVFEDNTTKTKDKDGNANYHIELFTIKPNSNEITKTPVTLKDKFINKIWLYENGVDDMVCAGFYNNGKSLKDADGIFMFKTKKDGKVFDLASYEIPVEVLNQYAKKKDQKKNDKKDDKGDAEFANLELRELLVQKDGSIVLIGEQYQVKTHTSYDGKTHRTYYTYHYNDLLVTKVDPAGKLAWMKKLPKRQQGAAGKGGMSYQYMDNGGYHTFLFLDNQKNLVLPVDEVPALHADGKGGFLTAYKVDDATGAVSKVSILDTRNVKGMEVYQFLPSRILPISRDEFVLEVYKKKKEDILIKVNMGKS